VKFKTDENLPVEAAGFRTKVHVAASTEVTAERIDRIPARDLRFPGRLPRSDWVVSFRYSGVHIFGHALPSLRRALRQCSDDYPEARSDSPGIR
jgi:hypothetical protein